MPDEEDIEYLKEDGSVIDFQKYPDQDAFEVTKCKLQILMKTILRTILRQYHHMTLQPQYILTYFGKVQIAQLSMYCHQSQ